MRIKEAAEKAIGVAGYVVGADHLSGAISEERRLIEEASGRSDALPIEAGARTATKVYGRRLRTMATYPAVLASRVSGLDAASRAIRHKRFPFQESED